MSASKLQFWCDTTKVRISVLKSPAFLALSARLWYTLIQVVRFFNNGLSRSRPIISIVLPELKLRLLPLGGAIEECGLSADKPDSIAPPFFYLIIQEKL